MLKRKKVTSLAFVGTALVLSVASVAFACTSFKGWLKVCDSGSTCVQSNGSGSGMNQSFDTGTGPTITRGTESFTVQTGDLGGGNKLPSGSYRITFWNGGSTEAYDRPITSFATTASHWKSDCMSDTIQELLGNVVKLGANVTVSSTGTVGPVSRTLPSNAGLSAAGEQAAVCISDSGANYGNQAPIVIV